jgi:hypothetical protein
MSRIVFMVEILFAIASQPDRAAIKGIVPGALEALSDC